MRNGKPISQILDYIDILVKNSYFIIASVENEIENRKKKNDYITIQLLHLFNDNITEIGIICETRT